MSVGVCPTCGKEYERLGQHWAMSSNCEYPPIPDEWMDVLTGVLMGDGTIHDPPSAKNVRIDVTNINRTFLQWLDNRLSWLSNGCRMKRSAEEIREENRRSEYERFANLDYEIRDQYILTTVRHPELNRFASWYGSEQKRFPVEITLSPNTLKFWYVCDGHLIWGNKGHTRPQAWISVDNEADRPRFITSLFDQKPIDPKFNEGRLMLTSDETEWFFDYVGKAPLGFEYKFITESKEIYRKSKREFYRNSTTQTE